MSSRRINALTKEGIKSLQNGRITNAILSFRHAIQCLKEPEQAKQHQQGMQDQEESYLLPLEATRMSFSESTAARECSPYNVFDIFVSAFIFPPTKDISSVRFELSIVLCYNLALAHHLAGLYAVENSKRHFQEAVKYYKLALTVFRSRNCLYFDKWYTLVLGVLTNMGFIFCHFWQVDDVRTCSSHIDQLLSSSAVLELSEQDGEFFFGMLTQAKDFHAKIAPAA